MIVVSFISQKGGTGKTSTALNLAVEALAYGLEVVVIDLDPQGNATSGLGVTDPVLTSGDVLFANQTGVALEAVVASTWDCVSVIPATLSLAQRDNDTQLGAEMRLKKALDSPDLDAKFGLVLIDCQPSIGKLVSNALIAASGALIVTEPSIDASSGVANTLTTVETVREHYNQDLSVLGVIVNKVPARSREADFRTAEITDALGEQVWRPFLPLRAVMPEARGSRQPIHSYGRRSSDLTTIFDTYLTALMLSC